MQIVGGESAIEVEGETLREALNDLVRQRPEVRVHLFDETRQLRQNVLCLHGDFYCGRRDNLDVPLTPDTEIAIVQASSGG